MKKITIFFVALLLGVGMLAPNTWATSYDPTGQPGNLPATPKSAIINNHGQIGDALFGELYRAIAPQDDPIFSNLATYVSIENVSNKWVAAHVRLRTGRFSIEAIDFPILLSPFDVFWFQFETFGFDGTRIVTITSTDQGTILHSGLDTYRPRLGEVSWDGTTLTMTLRPVLLEQFNLAAEYQSANELTMGHIEVFGLFSLAFPSGRAPAHNFFGVMGQLITDDWGACLDQSPFCADYYASYHENGLTFADRRIPAIDVRKDLTGHVFLGDFRTGVYAGYTMKAFKDFRAGVGMDGGLPAGCSNDPAPGQQLCTRPIAHRDLFIRGIFNGGGMLVNPATILYTYDTDAAYREPDWTTSFGPTWNDGDNWYGDPTVMTAGTPSDTQLRQIASVRSFSLDEVEDALYKRQVNSTYFNGGFSDFTFTMGVFTFPTKYSHFFFNNLGTGLYMGAWPVGSASGATNARSIINPAAMSRIGAFTGIWNLAEVGPRDPSSLPSILLPWETNFVPFGDRSLIGLAGFGFLLADDIDAVLVRNADGFNAGQWLIRDFFFTSGDPRCGSTALDLNTLTASDSAYRSVVCQGDFPNFFDGPFGFIEGFNLLQPSVYDPLQYKVPVSALVIDVDYSELPLMRTYDPSWDNNYDTALGALGGLFGDGGVFPFGPGVGGYGG